MEPYTGTETELTVIAVLDAVSFNYGVYTSERTISQVWPAAIRPLRISSSSAKVWMPPIWPRTGVGVQRQRLAGHLDQGTPA